MSDSLSDSIMAVLARQEITPREAVRKLSDAGEDPLFALEMVFAQLGGSDVIEVDDAGRKRYVPSGRLVNQVAREMRR